MAWFAGLDWGGQRAAVAVIDDRGRLIDQFAVTHRAEGLAELARRLARLAAPERIPIAIERPSGLLVDSLIEAGPRIIPNHPNAVKACRPRYRAAPGKSDPGDARMLADILRTDGHRLRALSPTSDAIRARQALVRSRGDLVAERVALGNRLRTVLDGIWPGAASIADLTSPSAGLPRALSDPSSAGCLGEKRLGIFLARQAYCGRRTPADLLARLRRAPGGHAGAAESTAKGNLVRTLTPLLAILVAELKPLTAADAYLVATLPDGRIVMSFPRAGRVCAAQILAAVDDVRACFPNSDQLAAEAGVCRSPTPPASAAVSAAAGPATIACAVPSPASPTTPATLPPGPTMSTNTPPAAAATAPMLSASSPVPGCASSGKPGKTTNPHQHPAAALLLHQA